jgi:hypothetical protein
MVFGWSVRRRRRGFWVIFAGLWCRRLFVFAEGLVKKKKKAPVSGGRLWCGVVLL